MAGNSFACGSMISFDQMAFPLLYQLFKNGPSLTKTYTNFLSSINFTLQVSMLLLTN